MDARDQKACQAILSHHEELVGGVRSRVAALSGAIASGQPHDTARAELVAFLASEVLTHAAAEEASLYPAASEAGLAGPIRAMVAEHRQLEGAVGDLARTTDPAVALAGADAIEDLFVRHVTAENEVVLPTLMVAEGVSLAGLLSLMHESYSAAKAGSTLGVAAESPPLPAPPDAEADPVLDVRELAPARRHQVIFTTYAGLSPAAAFVLVNDHDPKPLRYQLAAEHAGQFSWDYLEAGPEVWRVRIGKVPAPAAA